MHRYVNLCTTFSTFLLLVRCEFGQQKLDLKTPMKRNARSLNTIDDDDNYYTEPENKFAQFQEIMRQAKMMDGSINLNRLIQDQVRDPVTIADFNISSSGFITDIKGQFRDMLLYGLKQFRVDTMQINLSGMNLSADMFIPMLSIAGDYNLDGTVTFLQVSGDGGFWMNLTGISITGHSKFDPVEGTRVLRMDDVHLQSEVADIELQFDNLMGGGTWSRISNSLLNQLSELILDELKHSLLQELGKFLKMQFNDHLFTNLPEDLIDPEAPNVVDSVLKRVSNLIVENNLDPFPLPDHEVKFSRNMLFFTTNGEISLSNGYLHGLSSLSRHGDVILVLTSDSIMFEAGFGFKNLTGSFDWEAKVFDVGPEGSLEIQVKSIDGFLRFRQPLKAGSKVELDSFYVKDIRHVWLDIKGLGSWDYLLEVITNVLTNGVKLKIADSITEQVKTYVQKELDGLNFTMT